MRLFLCVCVVWRVFQECLCFSSTVCAAEAFCSRLASAFVCFCCFLPLCQIHSKTIQSGLCLPHPCTGGDTRASISRSPSALRLNAASHSPSMKGSPTHLFSFTVVIVLLFCCTTLSLTHAFLFLKLLFLFLCCDLCVFLFVANSWSHAVSTAVACIHIDVSSSFLCICLLLLLLFFTALFVSCCCCYAVSSSSAFSFLLLY